MLRFVVFIHVCAAMGIFGAAAIEGASPPLTESPIAMGAATGAGFLAGLPSRRRRASRLV
jgi:hypothetical protein